jgi:hypothetical protein
MTLRPAMSGGLGALSMAWVSAEAALPLGWRLTGLLRVPSSDDWMATAAGPLPEHRAEGRGGHPAQALVRLAEKLRERLGPTTG